MDKHKKNKKKAVRKLGSDQDYLAAFLDADTTGPERRGQRTEKTNRHGLPLVEDYEARFAENTPAGKEAETPSPEPEEDFARLLAQSFKTQPLKKKTVKPVPLKKRLNRYPVPEADLDLHGFTAIGAEARANSFIQTAMHQGFFTLRIIVGKGMHSPEGPVLPHVVEDLLKRLKAEKTILSYEWEGGRRKKSGALIVYLNQFGD